MCIFVISQLYVRVIYVYIVYQILMNKDVYKIEWHPGQTIQYRYITGREESYVD